MKTKTKFDPKVILQFAIDHTEKFVLGLVAVLFLLFAYESYTVTASGYTKKPEELKRATESASARIANGPPVEKFKKATEFLPYAEIIEGARKTIDANAYLMPPRVNVRIIPPRKLRDAPEVFAVEQLRAVPGRGAFLKAAGGAGTVGQRWIVVTGLVPIKKQLDEYRAKFEGAACQADDEPRYVGFLVQRAEVTAGSTGEPNWEKTMTLYPSASINEKFAKWTGSGGDVADSRFTFKNLTSPLPRLAGTWGEDVVCPPQIKLVSRDAKTQGEGPPGGGSSPPRPGAVRPEQASPERDANRSNPNDPGEANPADILGGKSDAQKPEAARNKAEEEQGQGPEYFLLRYFDFKVQPDKQYAYRIFLLLQNPNHGLEASVLEEAELSRFPLLGPIPGTEKKVGNDIVWVDTDPHYAKWSPSCTSSRVPGDMRVLAGAVSGPSAQQKDVNGDLRVLLWLRENGLNGYCQQEHLGRGTVLNFPQAKMQTPGTAKPTPHDLSTNSLLVDLMGGDPVPAPKERTLVSPGLILVLDEFGNLVMHDEAAESQEWENAKKEPDAAEQPPVDRPPKHGSGGQIKTTDSEKGKIDLNDIDRGKRPPHGH